MIATPDYGNWKELCAAAQRRCHTILDKEVAPVVKEIVKKHIQQDIYDAYTPIAGGWVNGTTYQRRHVLEGAIMHKFIDDDEILVTSTATVSKPIVKGYSFENRQPGAFLQLLESGHMGIWQHGFPRPAIGNAQREIDADAGGVISGAIRAGIDEYF